MSDRLRVITFIFQAQIRYETTWFPIRGEGNVRLGDNLSGFDSFEAAKACAIKYRRLCKVAVRVVVKERPVWVWEANRP
jgi:hypothetical protein